MVLGIYRLSFSYNCNINSTLLFSFRYKQYIFVEPIYIYKYFINLIQPVI